MFSVHFQAKQQEEKDPDRARRLACKGSMGFLGLTPALCLDAWGDIRLGCDFIMHVSASRELMRFDGGVQWAKRPHR